MKKAYLFVLTASMIVIGISVLVFEFRSKVGDSNEAPEVSQVNPEKTVSTSKNSDAIALDALSETNLTYTSKFTSFSVPQSLSISKTQTELKSVVIKESSIEVVYDQKQFCDSKQNIADQKGSYLLQGNELYLSNRLTQSDVLDKPCLVRVDYVISNIPELALNNASKFSVSFESESQLVETTPVCIYEKTVYKSGEFFISNDDCNTCSCTAGETVCTTDRVCEKKEVVHDGPI